MHGVADSGHGSYTALRTGEPPEAGIRDGNGANHRVLGSLASFRSPFLDAKPSGIQTKQSCYSNRTVLLL